MYPRAAAKRSGPTVDNFLKKIDQHMGVAIVGFAAFRDEEGKLCRFEYASIPPWLDNLLKVPNTGLVLQILGQVPFPKSTQRRSSNFPKCGEIL